MQRDRGLCSAEGGWVVVVRGKGWEREGWVHIRQMAPDVWQFCLLFFVVFTSPQIMQKIIPRKPLGSVHHAFSETEEMDSERGTTRNQLWTVHC